MNPIPPNPVYTQIKTNVIEQVSQILRVGQVLNATAEQGGKAQEKILIRLGQYLLQARTPVDVTTGDKLTLLVKALADGQTRLLPALEILDPKSVLAGKLVERASDAALNAVTVAKLRQFVSSQQSLTGLQQQIQNLLSDKTAQQTLPDTLRSQLLSLQDSIQIDAGRITAAELKQRVLNSGVFLESKLAAQDQSSDRLPVQQDIKYQLLSLKAEIARVYGVAPGQQFANQTLSQSQMHNLLSFIQNLNTQDPGKPQTLHNIETLANKLIAELPRPTVNLVMNMLSSSDETPTSLALLAKHLAGVGNAKLTIGDQLHYLAQTLISTTQQSPESHRNIQTLLEQLRGRLLLLDLGQQVDRSVSQLTSMQLQPLIRDDNTMTSFLLGMLFRGQDELFDMKMQVQQQERSSETADDSWQVTLSFNFKTLGEVQSHIHLSDTRVSTRFNAETETTANKIQSLLPALKQALEKRGLDVTAVSVATGLQHTRPLSNTDIRLLDESA